MKPAGLRLLLGYARPYRAALALCALLMLAESLSTYLKRRRNPESPRGKLHTHYLVHRLPLMLERQWWAYVAGQLADAASFERVFGRKPPAPVVCNPDGSSPLRRLFGPATTCSKLRVVVTP